MCSLTFAKIIKYIEGYDFEDFFAYDDADKFIDYLYHTSPEYYNQKWSCQYGATKLVIIMKDEDYVIKIPFHGESKDNYYVGAPTSEDFWDYCRGEAERYNEAPDVIKKHLAKTTWVYETSNGIRLYSQPKCLVAYKNHYNTKSQKPFAFFWKWWKKKKRGYALPVNHIDWLNLYIDCYGLDSLKSFFETVINEDWDDDLADRNIGFLDGRPVLIDYSSYWEQCFQEVV